MKLQQKKYLLSHSFPVRVVSNIIILPFALLIHIIKILLGFIKRLKLKLMIQFNVIFFSTYLIFALWKTVGLQSAWKLKPAIQVWDRDSNWGWWTVVLC